MTNGLSKYQFHMIAEILDLQRKHRRDITEEELCYWKGTTVSSMFNPNRRFLRQYKDDSGVTRYAVTHAAINAHLEYLTCKILRSSGPRMAFTDRMSTLARNSRRYELAEVRRRATPSSRAIE